MISRRTFTQGLLASTVAGASVVRAEETYPSRPIRLIVGLAPGGIADQTARFIAPRLGEVLGQSVVVENRTGAGGAIATRMVAASAADGYTLLVAFDGTHVTIPASNGAAGFDPVADFAPIGKVVDSPVLISAHPSFPAHDFGDLVRLAKTQLTSRGTIDFGTAGIGSTGHLTMELLKLRLNFHATHIPYRGGGDARAQVLGKQIPLMLAAVPTTSGDIRAGLLKGLAVTSARRTPALPNVPALAELPYPELKGVDINSWVGVVAPAKTPAAIIGRLHDEVAKIMTSADMKERLDKLGAEPFVMAPAAFDKFIVDETAKSQQIVRAAGIKLN